MSLFKKKKEGMPAERFELPELPSFSEMQQIKDAIKPVEMQQMQFQPVQQQMPIMQRREEERPSIMSSRIVTQEISEPISIRTEQEQDRGMRLKEPIFVKIDKFKDALANFEIIKEKLVDVDILLKKIKETKAKEQEELDSWEKEVDEIKDKIKGIDEKLFSRIG
ncbi:MAG: hypothetical protein V1886_00385 [archaeon]